MNEINAKRVSITSVRFHWTLWNVFTNYNFVGGIPRYILESLTAVLDENDKEVDSAEKRAYTDVKLALDNVKSVSTLVQ